MHSLTGIGMCILKIMKSTLKRKHTEENMKFRKQRKRKQKTIQKRKVLRIFESLCAWLIAGMLTLLG